MTSTFKAPVPAHEKLAAGTMLAIERGERLGTLNDNLLDAARAVLSHWESGDMAAAAKLLQGAVGAIDDHYDAVAALEAGWELDGRIWKRIATPGEGLDPELCSRDVWIDDGIIHCSRAEDALTQDDFRDLPRA